MSLTFETVPLFWIVRRRAAYTCWRSEKLLIGPLPPRGADSLRRTPPQNADVAEGSRLGQNHHRTRARA
jgi:hypothetical protein